MHGLRTNGRRPLDVNVEERIATRAQMGRHILGAGAVKVSVHGRVFKENSSRDLHFEIGARQEMVINPINLAPAG